jgi:glycosyltransferase involved in cell wall biosynthesis
VPPDDAEAFIAAIERLLDDEDARSRMGAAAREFVVGWASPAAVAGSYEELFSELIDRGHGRHRGT